MTKEEAINRIIQIEGVEKGKISDGYHTFDELYDHRIQLWITLCEIVSESTMRKEVWRTKTHSDGSSFEGWFVLGMNDNRKYSQITYHLPMSKWDDCHFAFIVDKAPEFDGHTSKDVLKRMKEIII